VFLDSERAKLQARMAQVVQRCDMRRAAISLGALQARARLRSAVDGVKMGMTVAEMLINALSRRKKRDS